VIAKAEGRLAALRLGGVDVDEWLASAQADSKVQEEADALTPPSEGGPDGGSGRHSPVVSICSDTGSDKVTLGVIK